MDTEYIRDYAMYAAIFGFFGMVWFGWAQEHPPKKWRKWLLLGSALSVLCGAIGAYLAATHWREATALHGGSIFVAYGIIVAVEVIAAGIGAFILSRIHKQAYISAWIALVVGAHFIPLAWLFQDGWLYALAIPAIDWAIIALLLARYFKVTVSTLIGAGMGVLLLVFALRGLVLFALAL